MDLKNTFTIPAPPEAAWPLLLDVARIAPCLPGATLTEVVDERTFKGRATVKVGPVSLAFEGVATLVEVDEAARSARLQAKGADPKGRGAAQAEARFSLSPDGAGTRVDILTTLALTGPVAQYGRASGLMQEVANQLVGQFARNLEAELARAPAAAASAAEPSPQAPPARAAEANAVSGVGLLAASLKALVGRWWRRLTGREAA